jgi:hypothetical protein
LYLSPLSGEVEITGGGEHLFLQNGPSVQTENYFAKWNTWSDLDLNLDHANRAKTFWSLW